MDGSHPAISDQVENTILHLQLPCYMHPHSHEYQIQIQIHFIDKIGSGNYMSNIAYLATIIAASTWRNNLLISKTSNQAKASHTLS